MFERYRVEASSIEDFLEKYYKRERYQARGAEYAAVVLAWHKKRFEEYGYDIISRHESVTGQVVSYFGGHSKPPALSNGNSAASQALSTLSTDESQLVLF